VAFNGIVSLFIYYLIHPKGKGGTKRLGLHKGASQKKHTITLTNGYLNYKTKTKNKEHSTKIYRKL